MVVGMRSKRLAGIFGRDVLGSPGLSPPRFVTIFGVVGTAGFVSA
jgi:hypothetical protein